MPDKTLRQSSKPNAVPSGLLDTGATTSCLLRTGALAVIGWLLLAPGFSHAQQPNILLIVADDIGFSDLGAFGGEIRTPNLDDLARTGLQLTNFHAAATCGPTRAMLMTGLNPHEVGLGSFGSRLQNTPEVHGLPGYRGSLDEDAPMVSELIDASGYDTYMVGKWHIGRGPNDPGARGFDRSFSLMDGGASHYADATGVYLGSATYTEDGKEVEQLPEEFFSTTFYTDRLIEYIDADRGSGRPFFAYLGYTAPHWPLQAPDEWLERARGRYDAGWDAIREQRIARMRELGLLDAEHTRYDSPSIPAWDELSDLAKRVEARRMEVYAAMVENLDHHIGRLLEYLETIGERENTVILFLSDNGPEGEELVEGDRLYWIPSTFDNRYENMGRPGSHILLGRGWAQASAGWEMFSHRALHRGNWKITWIWTPTGEAAWQLYDLSTDPAETIDLAEAYPERLQAMIAEWHAYAKETGVLPLDRDVSGFRSWQLVHE